MPSPSTMHAITQSHYGPPDEVLQLREVPVPVPGPDEVLVRVHAASVHADVWHVVTGIPRVLRLMGPGLRRPKQPIPGTDMAGRVEAVGRDVTAFAPGDAVFGETHRGKQGACSSVKREMCSQTASDRKAPVKLIPES
jgi:NADPH:quinone reductase-like Zn-dependent oxidoreductase